MDPDQFRPHVAGRARRCPGEPPGVLYRGLALVTGDRPVVIHELGDAAQEHDPGHLQAPVVDMWPVINRVRCGPPDPGDLDPGGTPQLSQPAMHVALDQVNRPVLVDRCHHRASHRVAILVHGVHLGKPGLGGDEVHHLPANLLDRLGRRLAPGAFVALDVQRHGAGSLPSLSDLANGLTGGR